MTDRGWLARWILANGVGMSLGFLTFLHVLFALAFGTSFELYWDEAAVAGIENPDGLLRFGLVLGLPLAGAIFASCQALVLRGRGVGLGAWVLSGPLGFAAPILVVWPLAAIWGDIPGPVEPFFIVGGGLLATAAFQWRALARRGVRGKRWVVLWALGLPAGMVAFMAAYLLIALITPVGWAAEVGLIGFFVGANAAAVSGPAFLRGLADASPPAAGPPE